MDNRLETYWSIQRALRREEKMKRNAEPIQPSRGEIKAAARLLADGNLERAKAILEKVHDDMQREADEMG